MTRTFAVRIDGRKYDTVARLARQRHATLSDAVRQALDAWIDQVRSEARRLPYAAMADLLGSVERPRRRAPKASGSRRKPRSRR